MKPSDVIFLLGRQRSGTTVFRDLLEKAGAFNCHEIMSANVEAPLGFYRRVARRVAEDPGFVWPVRHQTVFQDYVTEMRSLAGGRKMVMDLKYWGLNLIPVSEDIDLGRPFLLGYAIQTNTAVVHIVRRNKLRMIVSEMMLNKTGKWFAKQSQAEVAADDKPRLVIEPDRIVHQIDELIGLERRIRELVARVPRSEEVVYEEMFDAAGNFTPEVTELAARLVGVVQVDGTPRYAKMNPEPFDALVENAAAIRAILADTPHAWMMESD